MPSAAAVIAISMGLIGAIVGGFLALVSVRMPERRDIVSTPSRCAACERPIAPWHMIPVVSWLWLRGCCAACGAAISPRYLLIEVAGAVVGVWAALRGGDGLMIAATAILGWQLLLIAVIDSENFWLPDQLTWPLIATGLALGWIMAGGMPWPQVIGAVGGMVSLGLLAWLYRRVRGREGLGDGDPFLFAGAGAWVAWTGLPGVLLYACGIGLLVVLVRLMRRRAVSGSDRLPFGTFLAVGIWLTWLYGTPGV